eukprot:5929674-Prorocentrum_lima.AAC.1
MVASALAPLTTEVLWSTAKSTWRATCLTTLHGAGVQDLVNPGSTLLPMDGPGLGSKGFGQRGGI